MLRLIGIVISIGLADSINPTTVAPALYMAAQPGQRRRPLAQFTTGVFLVYFVGGLLIALGPGELVLALVPKPDLVTRHILEVLAGVVLLGVAAFLWSHRNRLGKKRLPTFSSQGRASWLLGVTITAVELPTALPYFGALAAVMGSDVDLPRKIFLILLYNVCFILPQLAMLTMLTVAGPRAEIQLVKISAYLQRRWPVLLAVVAVIAGLITIGLGATGTYRAANKLFHGVVKSLNGS
jgi:cytochrome c biogenesis protein CcdA